MAKLTKDDYFPIIDKKIYSVSTHLGLSLRVVYRFWVKDFKQRRMGIIITTFKNIVKVRCMPIDKMDRVIEDNDAILLPKEVDKFINTKLHCLKDFMDDHKEFRKFIIT